MYTDHAQLAPGVWKGKHTCSFVSSDHSDVGTECSEGNFGALVEITIWLEPRSDEKQADKNVLPDGMPSD